MSGVSRPGVSSAMGRPRDTGGPSVTNGAGCDTTLGVAWLCGAMVGRQTSSPAEAPAARNPRDRAKLIFHNFRMVIVLSRATEARHRVAEPVTAFDNGVRRRMVREGAGG